MSSKYKRLVKLLTDLPLHHRATFAVEEDPEYGHQFLTMVHDVIDEPSGQRTILYGVSGDPDARGLFVESCISALERQLAQSRKEQSGS